MDEVVASERVLIGGGPKVGKTTLASTMERNLGLVAMHTDDLIGKLDWSAASLEVSQWIDREGPWVIEGVSVARALRKWLERAAGKPAEIVFWSSMARVPRSKEQEAMAKGCETVWEPVREELVRRGVAIRYF